jgi:hypothetical protein
MPRIALLCVGLLIAPLAANHEPPAPILQVTDYTIQIENTMGHEMDFFYNDSTEHALGTIPGYIKQKFVIKSPARTSIEIIERGVAMGDYEMKKTVELSADSVVSVAF